MKTKLFALLFLVGSAAFAGPRVVVGIGVAPPAVAYVPPPVPYVAPAPVYGVGYWGPRAYYGPRWVAPRYYGPRYYGRGYYGGHWRR
jgi:hypothetical protein